MIAGNSTVFWPLDPFGGAEDFIAQGNVELWDLAVVNDESLGGLFKGGFIVQDTVL